MRKKIIQRGWPRGTVKWRREYTMRCPDLPDELPVPWINGPFAKKSGDFHSFRKTALKSAKARNCIVCGLKIDGPVYIAAQQGGPQTSGHGGHLRCIVLTIKRCPHMVEVAQEPDAIVAWRYDGQGVGVHLPDCNTYDGDGWGDCDPIFEDCVPLTLDELMGEHRRSTKTTRTPQQEER